MFHRIDRLEAMPGPLFCKYVWRLSAYGGAMSALVAAEQQRRSKTSDGRAREYVSNEEAASRAGDGVFEKVSA